MVLIFRNSICGKEVNASDDDSVSYGFSSVAVATFLVLTFASADLRAACALFVTRVPYNSILGASLLLSYVLLLWASMDVIFSSAKDDGSFILGAAAVLFISESQICPRFYSLL